MRNKKTLGIFALTMVAILGVGFAAAYQGDYSSEGPNYSEDRHEAMQEAFDDVNYDAWVALMTEDGRNPGVLRFVNEDNFEIFVEAHEAGINGDFDEASRLRAELGLGQGIMSRGGEGHGMKNGSGAKMSRQGNNGECPYTA